MSDLNQKQQNTPRVLPDLPTTPKNIEQINK